MTRDELRISELEKLLRESKRPHYHWYCCLHPDHIGKILGPIAMCSCGADDWNRRVDHVLREA